MGDDVGVDEVVMPMYFATLSWTMVTMTEYKLDQIAVGLLDLDIKNPRLPRSLQRQHEKEIIGFLIDHASITELMESICANGYFPGEPLIVIPDNERYVVIEGNRRSAALKLLHDPSLAKNQKNKILAISSGNDCKKPSEVPCLIAKDRNEVQKFLGFRHITGVKSWKALEKARYLQHLKESLFQNNGDSLSLTEISKELASIIGSRSDYVRRVLIAYDIFEKIEDQSFFKIPGLDDTTFFFTNLVDSLNRPAIAKYIGIDFESNIDPLNNLNMRHLSDWCHWLFEKTPENRTRVKGISKELTSLAKVIDNEKAMRAFKDRKISLEEAVMLTDDVEDLFFNSIVRAKNNMYEAKAVTTKLESFYTGLREDLREIAGVCREINDIQANKQKDEFDV